MPEYIEREAAIKFVKELMEEVNNKTAINGSYVTKTYDMAIRHATKLLRYVPTAYPKADVVEVVRGRWIKRQFADESTAFGYSCSECHSTYEVDTNYCPNCGAKMDGKKRNKRQRSVKTMEDKKYKVFVDDKIFAEYMSLETAMILVKALFDTYYNEYGMTVSIREEERATVAEGA